MMGKSFAELRHQSRTVNKEAPARRLSPGGGVPTDGKSLAELRHRSRGVDQEKPHRFSSGGAVTAGKAADGEMRAMEKLAAKQHKAAGGGVPDPSWVHHQPNWMGYKNGGRQPRERKAAGGGVSAAAPATSPPASMPQPAATANPAAAAAQAKMLTLGMGSSQLADKLGLSQQELADAMTGSSGAPATRLQAWLMKAGAKSGGRQPKGKR